MARKSWMSGLLILSATAVTLGCTHNAVQQKPPPDPLLTSVKVTNKPVEARPQSATLEAKSQMYPLPPALPEASQVTPAVRTVPLPAYKD